MKRARLQSRKYSFHCKGPPTLWNIPRTKETFMDCFGQAVVFTTPGPSVWLDQEYLYRLIKRAEMADRVSDRTKRHIRCD